MTLCIFLTASNSNAGPINRTYTLTFFVTSHDEAEREKSNGRTTLETFNTGVYVVGEIQLCLVFYWFGFSLSQVR
jgi:hypothetical protein